MHYHVVVLAYEEMVGEQFRNTSEADIIIHEDVTPKDVASLAVDKAKALFPKKNGYYVRTIIEHDDHEK